MFARQKSTSAPAPTPESAALDRLTRRARLYILAERAARALAFLVSLALLFLALSWGGLWLALGPAGRMAGVAAFFAIGAFAALRAARRLAPAPADIIARIDAEAPAALRPAASLNDSLADPAPTPAARTLWAAHRRRLDAVLRGLTLAPPQPALAPRDPYALRGLALVAAIAAGFAAGDDKLSRLNAAFDWRGGTAADVAAARVDAWIAPPAYTGRPQIVLDGGSDATVAAPVNSLLHVRARSGGVSVSGGLAPAQDAGGPTSAAAAREQIFKLSGDATLTLPDGRAYALSAIPDQPPTIALIPPLRPNSRGSLTLSFHTEDDYGVAGAEAVVSGDMAKNALVPPPRFPLSPPAERSGRGDARATLDLSDSPWAGARASLTLTARDEGGNEGQSEPVELTLPQRRFVKPLARALVEQRRILLLTPQERLHVVLALSALDIAPEMFDTPSAIHLGLHEAMRTLGRFPNDDALRALGDMLWAMALSIEDGDVSQAEKDLRAAEKNLREALARGADDEEISRLTQDLRAALDNFLQGLARGQNRKRDPAAATRESGGDAVSEQDLQAMLDDMAKAGKSGDLDEARRLLDNLEDVLENLQTAEGGASGGKSGSGARSAARARSEIDRLSREQQQLRDETFQKSRPEANGGDGAGDERRRQEGLRSRLERQMDALRRSGEETPGDFDAAQEAMKEAESALGQGAKGRGAAVDAQGRALSALRRGADKLAERGKGPGQGEDDDENAESESERGQRLGDGKRQDPLGRGPQKGKSAKFDSPAVRARRLQEELRQRLGQPERPPQELDYLERLLKR